MKELPEYDIIVHDEETWFTKAIEEAEKKEKEKNERHSCHLMGYNPMLGDTCEKCDSEWKDDKRKDTKGTDNESN